MISSGQRHLPGMVLSLGVLWWKEQYSRDETKQIDAPYLRRASARNFASNCPQWPLHHACWLEDAVRLRRMK